MMKKKIVLFLLSALLCTCILACGSDNTLTMEIPTAEALQLQTEESGTEEFSEQEDETSDNTNKPATQDTESGHADRNTEEASSESQYSDEDTQESQQDIPDESQSSDIDLEPEPGTDQVPSNNSVGEKIILSDSQLSEQISVFVNNQSIWQQNSEFELWQYTLTDLDFNGRLELIAATCNGTGLFTTAYIYEISEDLSSIAKCEDGLSESEDFTDLLVSTTNYFFDEDSKSFCYLFTNVTRNGASENYESQDAISLTQGKISITKIAGIHSVYDELGMSSQTYADSKGKEITEEQYYSAVNTVYPHMSQLSTCSFNWISVIDEKLPDRLSDSYRAFTK